jgi:hypothetical protein
LALNGTCLPNPNAGRHSLPFINFNFFSINLLFGALSMAMMVQNQLSRPSNKSCGQIGSPACVVIPITRGSVNSFGIRVRFRVGQRWINQDPIYGTFVGEVIETSDRGRRGTVIITDEQGNVLDIFNGTSTAFHASGEWQLIEE